jgi:hypothetical protein
MEEQIVNKELLRKKFKTENLNELTDEQILKMFEEFYIPFSFFKENYATLKKFLNPFLKFYIGNKSYNLSENEKIAPFYKKELGKFILNFREDIEKETLEYLRKKYGRESKEIFRFENLPDYVIIYPLLESAGYKIKKEFKKDFTDKTKWQKLNGEETDICEEFAFETLEISEYILKKLIK